MTPNLASSPGRSSTELGGHLLWALSLLATRVGDFDVLLAQDPIAALDRIDQLLLPSLELAHDLAFSCRAAIVRERGLADPDDTAA